jgi:hypothetical protein
MRLYAQGELKLLTTISGEEEGDHFYKVCPAGDVNGDGYDDFLVGTEGGMYVKLYFGGNPFDTLNCIKYQSSEQYMWYSKAIASDGDINNDGYKDFALGLVDGIDGSGKVCIFYGGPQIKTEPDITISSTIPDDFFKPMTMCGDLNGDGYDDLVTFSLNGTFDARGKVMIFFGGSKMDTIPDVVLWGQEQSDHFGYAAEIVGDTNGDGFDDLLVGVPQILSDVGKNGKAFLFYGGNEIGFDNSFEFYPDSTSQSFASDVWKIGDVDGDGYKDFAFGDWCIDLISGKTCMVMKRMISSGIISNGYDLNKDGYDDFLTAYIYQGNYFQSRAGVFLGGTRIDSIPAYEIIGGPVRDSLGKYLKIGGDINGDGKVEIFVSEYGKRTPDGRKIGIGKVFIYNWENYSSVKDKSGTLSSVFSLNQNYPNPFNDNTVISYIISQESYVLLSIYNSIGQRIKIVKEGVNIPGNYKITWEGVDYYDKSVPSGVYFLRCEVFPTNNKGLSQQKIIKMILMK